MPSPENRRIAQRLREAAFLLRSQGASPYRADAYRQAADAIDGHPRELRAIYQAGGVKALDAVPRVGLGIASAIAEMLVTGRWAQLDRLRGAADAETQLRAVPGVGRAWARRIHQELRVDSLEDFEVAATDGRLERLPGMGARRAAALRAALAETLDRVRATRPRPPGPEPGVSLLLEVDAEYRAGAAAGRLPSIAPRRFNPAHARLLPILHAQRGAWHFTALFSNTPLAHRLGRTHDWVVIYFYDGDHVERSRTVVTETRGPLRDRRVVRGREDECAGLARPSPGADRVDQAA